MIFGIGVDVLDKRLESLQAVLNVRKEAVKEDKKAQAKSRRHP